MDQQTGPGSPGISIMFLVIGFIVLFVGVLAFFLSASDNDNTGMFAGAGAAMSSLFLFAVSAIITRLHKIEHHLRPAGTDIPEAAVIYCACGQMTAERAKESGHICTVKTP